ncbi:MAG TPA: hypothetical protein VNH53_03995 [Sphingomicrobium sp.]|nr:hypothetical protein [Sphingomicrobium sp.]
MRRPSIVIAVPGPRSAGETTMRSISDRNPWAARRLSSSVPSSSWRRSAMLRRYSSAMFGCMAMTPPAPTSAIAASAAASSSRACSSAALISANSAPPSVTARKSRPTFACAWSRRRCARRRSFPSSAARSRLAR